MSNLDQAREWAEKYQRHHVIGPEDEVAAVGVIRGLPDQWIDAEKLRKVVDDLHPELKGGDIEQALRHLLPTPPLPTLAELIEAGNEPKQYQWMQADHIEHGRVIITHPGDTFIYYMKQSGLSGGVSLSSSDRITPLPDLPKLEWPGSGDAPTVAEHANVAPDQQVSPQVNLDSSLPRPEDVPAGEAWLVEHDGHEWVVTRE